jgi:hypothetical protein
MQALLSLWLLRPSCGNGWLFRRSSQVYPIRMNPSDQAGRVRIPAVRMKKPGLLTETGLLSSIAEADQPRVRERIMKLS